MRPLRYQNESSRVTLPEQRPRPHATLAKHLEKQFEKLGLTSELPKLVSTEYRLYSQIALRIAFWHKRMVQALLEKTAKEVK